MATKKQLLYFLIITLISSFLIALIISGYLTRNAAADSPKPHIIVIVADDMGWNDVGFHGSNQIPTPNIDALAYNGIILDRFYTQLSCTPSRTALLTGNYPMRSGMHGYPLKAGENRSLPIDMPTMPEQLKKLGYKTHLVGKWHLGAAHRRDTPLGRGFDTHFGYWNGFVSYFDYITFRYAENHTKIYGFDLHDQFRDAWEVQGRYATEVFTEKSLEVIENHDNDEPLFLLLTHLAPHTGKNGDGLEVPDANLTDLKYSYIEDPRRRRYADIVNLMDISVGSVVKKLSDKNMLANSVILFFSDNGAQTVGLYENSGSNWPLRGLKFSDFEGGVRSAAAIYSPLFKKTGYVNRQLIHISDWLPTFYSAAGGDLRDLGKLDGVNQWDTLSQNKQTERSEILLNVDEVHNTSAIIQKGYKFLKGTYEEGLYDRYYGESGRNSGEPPYDVSSILNSQANNAIRTITKKSITLQQINQMRSESDLSWCRSEDFAPVINCTNGCLFDLQKDPCETANVIEVIPEIAQKLFKRLSEFYNELVLQKNQNSDPNSDPLRYNNTWCTWLDDKLCVKTSNLSKRLYE